MKKNVMTKLAAVVVLAALALPGCDYTSAQLTGLFQDLSAIGVSAVFDLISARINPDDNTNLQDVIDIGEDAAKAAIDNRIDQQIPHDPKPATVTYQKYQRSADAPNGSPTFFMRPGNNAIDFPARNG